MRNKLYLWVAGLCLCVVYPASFCLAQTSDAFRTQMNSVFQNVNPTPISSGLLWDYGLELTDATQYNGTITSTNYVNLAEWRMLYSSLYTMRFNNNISMTAPATVNSQITSNGMLSTAHNIVALHVRYQKFRSNATSLGVTIANNKLTCGNTTAPYETRYAFAATLNHSLLEGKSHRFIFRSALFYNKSGKTISNIKADFGDGQGYRAISQNTEVTANYSTEGEKTFKLKITYTDASVAEGFSKFYVKNIQPIAARYIGTNILTRHFPVAGFQAPRPYNGAVGGATVTIQYAGTNQVLDRPLIVLEGLDPWKILSPDDPTSNSDFDKFITGSVNAIINLDRQGQTLSEALEEGGYDLVFVDFDEGMDYIQRNAFLVENIIQWVNQEKAKYRTRQPNVVLGMSMGGVVGRYALRDMEKNLHIAHDTRLYIGDDAPQQGSNVLLSAQAAVRHLSTVGIGLGFGIYYSLTLADLNDDLKKTVALLGTPAARQLLQYQMGGAGNNLGFDNSEYTTFMTKYRNLGYPTQTRNVAMASGSECAPQQPFGPYATLLSFDDSFKLKYWQTIVSSLLAHYTTYFVQLRIGFPLTTKTDLRANIILNALPDHQALRIYKGKISIVKKILFVINVSMTLVDKSLNASSSMLPLDSAPGGFIDINEFAGTTGSSTLTDLTFRFTQFCHVPTTRSLDIGSGTQTILTADLLRLYSPPSPPPAPKNTPFANFFTHPIENVRHTEFTTQNG